jgi:hypothetical protein
MNVFLLREREILQQRLDMFPARQVPNSTKWKLRDTREALSRSIAKNSPLHVSRLHLATVRFNLSIRSDAHLGNVDGVVIVL